MDRQAQVEVNLRVIYSLSPELPRIAETIRNLLEPLSNVEVVSIWKINETALIEDKLLESLRKEK